MADVRIRCRPGGPYVVEGTITLVDSDGNPFPLASDKPAIALCRCGQSANRPFCDGSHKQIGFDADEKAPMA